MAIPIQDQLPTNDFIPCPNCEGYGWTVEMGCCNSPTPYGSCCGNAIQVQEECKVCNGSGKIDEQVKR